MKRLVYLISTFLILAGIYGGNVGAGTKGLNMVVQGQFEKPIFFYGDYKKIYLD